MAGTRTKLSERELRAWQALLHTHQHVLRNLDGELRAQHNLALGDYDVLVRLARVPERSLRMSDLAERVMFSPSGLTRVVDRLVARGLVRRERSSRDARVMLACLTDEGSRLVRHAARTHLRGIREHFTDHLTPDQLEQVATALETITGPHRPH